MRRKKPMSGNRHLHNILGGLRRRGMGKAERNKVKRWIETVKEFKCVYCVAVLQPWTYSLDHRVPLVLGGANMGGNLAICCKRCNLAKGSLSDADFIALLAGLRSLTGAGATNVLARLRAAGKFYRR